MLFYHDVPGATQTTNATPNTANDSLFVKPGTSRCVWIKEIMPSGRAATATSITGVGYRVQKWTSTASSGGTALTPTPDDEGYQAAQHTAGWSASAVTSGTGGPTLQLYIGSGSSSPGPWVARSPTLDDAPMLQAGENKSMDIWNVAGSASQIYELSIGTAE